MNNKLIVILTIVLIIYEGTEGFIFIPEELPSILSIFFSNVPPIKKGTDSRVAFGFRIGPNADYQVQYEIGPQLNTQPLGPPAEPSTSKKRRQSNETEESIEKVLHNRTTTKNDDKKLSDPAKKNTVFVNQLKQLYNMIDKKNKVEKSIK